MKKYFFTLLLLVSLSSFSQTKNSYFQADYFYGNVLSGSAEAKIFLEGHPTGFFASYNVKTTGLNDWNEVYNYPDVGISFGYQDYKSDILGDLYSVYAHYNFYLLNRKSENQLILRTGIGLAYNTNPYNKDTNNKNTAFGTAVNSSTYLKLYYQRGYILGQFGLTAGLTFVHASNSNIKSPNSGVNIWAATAGINYNLSPKEPKINFIPTTDTLKIKEPIKINLAVRGGVNESQFIGSGVKPFLVTSAYLDKRISRKSAFQLGLDAYFSPMLKDHYEISSVRPGANIEEPNSFIRVGTFIGYELIINKLSLETQLGYYIVYPVEFDGKIYETLGLKRYFTNDRKWYASIRLKAHVVNAETVEFGIGIRL